MDANKRLLTGKDRRERATGTLDIEVAGHVCHIDMTVATSENVALRKCPDRSSSSKPRFALVPIPGDSVLTTQKAWQEEHRRQEEHRQQEHPGQSGCMHPQRAGSMAGSRPSWLHSL